MYPSLQDKVNRFGPYIFQSHGPPRLQPPIRIPKVTTLSSPHTHSLFLIHSSPTLFASAQPRSLPLPGAEADGLGESHSAHATWPYLTLVREVNAALGFLRVGERSRGWKRCVGSCMSVEGKGSAGEPPGGGCRVSQSVSQSVRVLPVFFSWRGWRGEGHRRVKG